MSRYPKPTFQLCANRYLATPEVLSLKDHGDVLRERYPKRKLPRVGYVPYLVVLAIAPATGLRRDFVKCV